MTPFHLTRRTRSNQLSPLPEWRRAARCDRPGTQGQCSCQLRQRQPAPVRRGGSEERHPGRPAPVALFGAHRVREDLHQFLGSHRAQAGAIDRRRHLCLPRDGKEQRAGREPPRIDHRPLPGRPGLRVDEATSHVEAVFMSQRDSHARPARPSTLRRIRHLRTERCTARGRFLRPSPVPVAQRRFRIVQCGVGPTRKPLAMRSMKRWSSVSLPCLSGHTLRAFSGARRHVAALLPDSSPKASLGPCSRTRVSALGSRASRSGFAKG